MKRHLQYGFTIIELMIGIAVMGIALAFAVPNFEQFILDNRMISRINEFSASLALARSEAAKQNELVVLCPSTNGTQCASAGTDWDQGWVIFIDRNADLDLDPGASGNDGCAQGNASDCLLLTFPGLENNVTLEGGGDVPELLAYRGDGTVRCDSNSDGTLENCDNADTYFVMCDKRGAGHARALGISSTGRAAVITKKPNGTALTCTP